MILLLRTSQINFDIYTNMENKIGMIVKENNKNDTTNDTVNDTVKSNESYIERDLFLNNELNVGKKLDFIRNLN